MTIIDLAIRTAREAGEILRDYAARGFQIESKGRNNLVTEADLASERHITAAIRGTFPAHHILAEESGGTLHSDLADDYYWIVDPLDGTTNFAHGFPLYCVSLGLVRGGEPVLGVVYLPALNELFTACAGSGTRLNGESVQVSAISRLEHTLLATGFSYDTHSSDSNLGNFLGFQRSAQATRRIGSCAINLSYLAAGRWDGYWELKTKTYDVAAGIILVREAGGQVSDFDGGQDMLGSGRIVASNSFIHTAMLDVLARAGDRD